MSTEHNKAQVRRFFEEAFIQGNGAVVDELFAPGCIYHLYADVVSDSAERARASRSGACRSIAILESCQVWIGCFALSTVFLDN